jgi:hypothetical protein
MARTDQFLEDCFSQYEVIQTDVIVIWYVIENFKSYQMYFWLQFFLSAISDLCICLTCQSCHPKYQEIFDWRACGQDTASPLFSFPWLGNEKNLNIKTDVIVIWYVIENFKSYRHLLVSSLNLKYKMFVDSSIQDFSMNIRFFRSQKYIEVFVTWETDRGFAKCTFDYSFFYLQYLIYVYV